MNASLRRPSCRPRAAIARALSSTAGSDVGSTGSVSYAAAGTSRTSSDSKASGRGTRLLTGEPQVVQTSPAGPGEPDITPEPSKPGRGVIVGGPDEAGA